MNLLEARALFSESKISDLLDPALGAPKAYLSSIGIAGNHADP